MTRDGRRLALRARHVEGFSSRLRLSPKGKHQAAVCSKMHKLAFLVLTLFRVCSIAVADWVERSLNQKSFIVFHQRENSPEKISAWRLPFAVTRAVQQ